MQASHGAQWAPGTLVHARERKCALRLGLRCTVHWTEEGHWRERRNKGGGRGTEGGRAKGEGGGVLISIYISRGIRKKTTKPEVAAS